MLLFMLGRPSHKLTEQTAIIESPDFPRGYSGGIEESWSVTVEDDQVGYLKLWKINRDCYGDKISFNSSRMKKKKKKKIAYRLVYGKRGIIYTVHEINNMTWNNGMHSLTEAVVCLCWCSEIHRFWDRKCLDLRGTRTPNLRINVECSNLLSYQGQIFAVPCCWIQALAV